MKESRKETEHKTDWNFDFCIYKKKSKNIASMWIQQQPRFVMHHEHRWLKRSSYPFHNLAVSVVGMWPTVTRFWLVYSSDSLGWGLQTCPRSLQRLTILHWQTPCRISPSAKPGCKHYIHLRHLERCLNDKQGKLSFRLYKWEGPAQSTSRDTQLRPLAILRSLSCTRMLSRCPDVHCDFGI